jgi:hypothetical protein
MRKSDAVRTPRASPFGMSSAVGASIYTTPARILRRDCVQDMRRIKEALLRRSQHY